MSTCAEIYRVSGSRSKRIIIYGHRRGVANITAMLLGDPPPGRREQLAAMSSPYYMAGNESGRLHRRRGKKIIEHAE